MRRLSAILTGERFGSHREAVGCSARHRPHFGSLVSRTPRASPNTVELFAKKPQIECDVRQ